MNTFKFKLIAKNLEFMFTKMYVSNYKMTTKYIFSENVWTYIHLNTLKFIKYSRHKKKYIYITVQKIIFNSKQNKNILVICILHIIVT